MAKICHSSSIATNFKQMKICLISDTHGYVGNDIKKHLEQCDEIWHAGDIGSMQTADELSAIKPLRAVHGNIDDHTVRSTYGQDCTFCYEDVSVFMTHIGGYPGRYDARVKKILQDTRPKLFISGHSHILKVMFDKKLDLLHINPGAAGIHGFHQIRTLLRFEIDGSDIHNLSIVEFPKKIRN